MQQQFLFWPGYYIFPVYKLTSKSDYNVCAMLGYGNVNKAKLRNRSLQYLKLSTCSASLSRSGIQAEKEDRSCEPFEDKVPA